MEVKITFDEVNVRDTQKINDIDIVMVKGEKGDTGYPTDAQVATAVDEWLTEHPEATTTVQDGSITLPKLANDVRAEIDTKADAIVKSASGSIASFSDGGDELPMKSLKVNIVPKQSGTGDPSPSNVRAISGWDSVGTTRAGKNLCPTNAPEDNGTWNASAEELTVSGTRSYNSAYYRLALKAGKTYTFSAYAKQINGKAKIGLRIGRITQLTISSEAIDEPGWVTFQYTPVEDIDARFTLFSAWGTAVQTSVTYGEIQIEVGTTATDYEPYQGSTITTNLGQTVYGGVLDVVSGKLTSFPYYSSYNGETLNGEWMCDRAVYSQGTTPPTGSQVVDMSGTGAETQLTPTQVNTLLGSNNIWADAGTVEVEYRADTTLAYNELLSLIASLS